MLVAVWGPCKPAAEAGNEPIGDPGFFGIVPDVLAQMFELLGATHQMIEGFMLPDLAITVGKFVDFLGGK